MANQEVTRRAFVAKAAYVAPAIVTLAVAPSYAKNGSDKDKDKEEDKDKDKP